MAGRWNRAKLRKPLETSLGQAPREPSGPDVAHLRQPITTSVRGLKQAFDLFQNATAEVQEYVTHECDVLYECRCCRSIFRSLANFILHKRSYCKEKFEEWGPRCEGGFVAEADDASEGGKDATLEPIIDGLLKRQEMEEAAQNALNTDLSKEENSDDDNGVREENTIVLEKIPSTQQAVFQTYTKDKTAPPLMRTEVMEIHGILDNNETVLGSDGKICNFETNKRLIKRNFPVKNLVCKECNFTFSTMKTLTHHIRYKHNKTCIVYPCPDCKQTFSNPWSVYRHLIKIHRRTNAQVRRMRPQIHAGRIRKEQEPPAKNKVAVAAEEDEENQWMNNMERDKDFQMCGGCGRRFERKAALQSHSQICVKRIAVCNTIKERKNKPKLVEKTEKETESKVLKGAAKRKPTFTRNYATNGVDSDSSGVNELKAQEEVFTISDDSCDDSKDDWNDEFKAYVNDETDHGFLSKAAPFMAKNELKCLPCNDTFVSPYQLLWHMSLHFSWFRFQCSKCSFCSFNKYDCTTHAHAHHGTPYTMMEYRVLPIPKWKVLVTAHDFKELTQELINNNTVNVDKAMPVLEISKKGGKAVIDLDDEDMPDICSNAQIIPLGETDKPVPSASSTRPVRNRIRSVKTAQNDFIYDLAKVLKLNDNAKNAKLKRTTR